MAKGLSDLLRNIFGGTSADRTPLGPPPEWGQRADRYPVLKARHIARLPVAGPMPAKRASGGGGGGGHVPVPARKPNIPLPLWGPKPAEKPETYAGQERYGGRPETYAGQERYDARTPETYAGQERYGSGPQTYAGQERYQPYPTVAEDQTGIPLSMYDTGRLGLTPKHGRYLRTPTTGRIGHPYGEIAEDQTGLPMSMYDTGRLGRTPTTGRIGHPYPTIAEDQTGPLSMGDTGRLGATQKMDRLPPFDTGRFGASPMTDRLPPFDTGRFGASPTTDRIGFDSGRFDTPPQMTDTGRFGASPKTGRLLLEDYAQEDDPLGGLLGLLLRQQRGQ